MIRTYVATRFDARERVVDELVYSLISLDCDVTSR
jgi:hypothetical protein